MPDQTPDSVKPNDSPESKTSAITNEITDKKLKTHNLNKLYEFFKSQFKLNKWFNIIGFIANLLTSITLIVAFFLTHRQLKESAKDRDLYVKHQDSSFAQQYAFYKLAIEQDSIIKREKIEEKLKDSIYLVQTTQENLRNAKKDEATIQMFKDLSESSIFQKEYQIDYSNPQLGVSLHTDSLSKLFLNIRNIGNRTALNIYLCVTTYYIQDSISTLKVSHRSLKENYSTQWHPFKNKLLPKASFSEWLNISFNPNAKTFFLIGHKIYDYALPEENFWWNYDFFVYYPKEKIFGEPSFTQMEEIIALVTKNPNHPLYNFLK